MDELSNHHIKLNVIESPGRQYSVSTLAITNHVIRHDQIFVSIDSPYFNIILSCDVGRLVLCASSLSGWLDDIGLPQYKTQFDEGRVDGRMLHYMTVVSVSKGHELRTTDPADK